MDTVTKCKNLAGIYYLSATISQIFNQTIESMGYTTESSIPYSHFTATAVHAKNREAD